MSLHAMSWAFGAPKAMPSADKFVLLALADHADAEGRCWPSVDRIARMTNLHRSTVWRSIDRLCNEWHVVAKLTSGGGRAGRTNLFRLDVGPWKLPAALEEHEVELDDRDREATGTPSLFADVDGLADELRSAGVIELSNIHRGRTTRRERVAPRDATGRTTRRDGSQGATRIITEPPKNRARRSELVPKPSGDELERVRAKIDEIRSTMSVGATESVTDALERTQP